MQTIKSALIIFVRNPIPGKVKSRLAATIGEANALKVYQFLLHHTYEVIVNLNCDKYVFYDKFIQTDDHWQGDGFYKRLQQGNDLGDRMKNAFSEIFFSGYERALIIGSDCYELSTEIADQGLLLLSGNDMVIGPAVDGGYYLLGMKKLQECLFDNKRWSSSTVFSDTMQDIKKLGLTYAVLPVLNDVDEEQDITFLY